MSGDGVQVVAVDEQTTVEVESERWRQLAVDALTKQGVTGGECNLLFVDSDAIQELNDAHRGKDRPTDVLSFPLDGAAATEPHDLIGDIVVCPEIAATNAPQHEGQDHHRGSVEDELALLVVHGVLHLLGYDHMQDEEAEVMERLEQQLLGEFYL